MYFTYLHSYLLDTKLQNKQSTSWSLPEDDSESLGATAGCGGRFSAFFLCANNFSSYKIHYRLSNNCSISFNSQWNYS